MADNTPIKHSGTPWNSVNCPATKEEVKKSLQLLWKSVVDTFSTKEELQSVRNAIKNPVVVVDSKDSILEYKTGVLYVINQVPYVWDKNDLVPLTDSQLGILENKLTKKIEESSDNLNTLIGDLNEFIFEDDYLQYLLENLPKATHDKPGLMGSEEKTILKDLQLRMLTILDADEARNLFGNLITIQD